MIWQRLAARTSTTGSVWGRPSQLSSGQRNIQNRVASAPYLLVRLLFFGHL